MAAIHLLGLSKRFVGAQQPALDGLDLEVADGELLVLVGPSGCGKSTALRLVAGLEEPTAGDIQLAGASLRDVPPQHRDVAMVFQGYALYPHMTVADNIAFPLKMRRERDRETRVGEVAELVGLGDKLQRLPHELSGGERQRVAMARAMVRRPKAFLFDEPLSNLDAKLRAELRVEIAALVRELGTTSLYVTHDQAEAMTMGDRVAVLSAGKLQQVAPPREIYERPQNTFVAGFVGTPPMNLVDVQIADGVATTGSLQVALPAGVAQRDAITVGFRPEHVVATRPSELGAEIQASVRAREPLGPATLLHLVAGDTTLRARAPGFSGPDIDADVTLFVAAEHLCFFDADTGVRWAE